MLDQPLEVQREQLESVRYFRQSLQRVVVAAVQDHLLKTVHLAVLVVVVLRIQAQAVQLLQPVKVLQGDHKAVVLEPKTKLLVVVVRLRLGLTAAQQAVMAVRELHPACQERP